MRFTLNRLCQVALAMGLASACLWAVAQEFKTSDECKPGMAVMNRQNVQGTVVASDGPYCKVLWPDGKQTTAFAWSLRPADASTNTTDKLVNGVYPCYSGSNFVFMEIRIDGPDAYQDGKGAKGKLLPDPRIGMNMTGGSYYSVTCSPKK